MDIYIKNLLTDVLRAFRIDTKPVNNEAAVVINEQHPFLLKYDPINERLLIIGSIDLQRISNMDRFYQQMGYSALNSLNGTEPVTGMDEHSQRCFSFLAVPRTKANTDNICKEVFRLLEWNEQLVRRC